MECPHCGFEVSEGLKVCAWCEQSLETPPLPRRTRVIRGVLLTFSVLFLAFIGILPFLPRHGKKPPIELRAQVRLQDGQFTFLNGDPFDWRSVTLTVRAGRPAVDYHYGVECIPAGQTYRVRERQFTTPEGRAFNPASGEILTVSVRCQTPKGAGVWFRPYGFFLPDER
jgi:hypothetical protein